MKNIGLVIAVEMEPFKEVFGEPKEIINTTYTPVYYFEMENAKINALKSGAGEIAGAAATQLLISEFKVDYIFNCGVVGGLNKELIREKICLVEKVVHYDFDTSKIDKCEVGRYLELDDIWIKTDPNLIKEALNVDESIKLVKCASGDKFIADKETRESLFNTYGTEICEMEAAGIALTAYRNNVPCLLLKVVSDDINDDPDVFWDYHGLSVKCFEILKSVINHISAVNS